MNQVHLRLLTLMIAALLQCATAQSAVISMDLRQSGDGLLTYDTINHRDWLDLSETGGWSLAITKQALAPGGQYDDFHIATVSDVTDFVASAGYDGTSHVGQPFFSVATQLIDLLNQDLTYTTTTTLADPTGGYDKTLPTGAFELVARFADAWASSGTGSEAFADFMIATMTSEQVGMTPNDSSMTSFAEVQTQYDSSSISQYRAVWLYHEVAVPEPAAFSLFALAVIPLIFFHDTYRRPGQR